MMGRQLVFLPPLDQKESAKYWETVLAPEVILYVAKINNEVAGVFNYISLQSLMGFIELKFVS